MTLKIPVVFDPVSRLVIEDPTGSTSPFEALADLSIVAGSFVNVYSDAGIRKIRLADATISRPAMGYVLENWVNSTTPMSVNTGGINKQAQLIQGDGLGGNYTFTSADLGLSVFLDNHLSGKISKTKPTDSPNYQRIGEVVGVTNTNIEVAFRPTINDAQDVLALKGTWDASTNTPSLITPPTGSRGWYYIVSHAGSSLVGGVNTWNAGDWIISDGVIWGRIQNTVQLQLTPNPGGVSPHALGTAAIGTSPDAAHADHTHPMIPDATIQGIVLSQGGDALPLPAAGVGDLGTAVRGSREDHVHPTNVVKTPMRFYFESALTTTDKQPTMRIDGTSKFVGIHYFSLNPGTGTILIKVNTSTVATIGLSITDTGFVTQPGFTPLTLSPGDAVTAVVAAGGSANQVTLQLDIEQSV